MSIVSQSNTSKLVSGKFVTEDRKKIGTKGLFNRRRPFGKPK